MQDPYLAVIEVCQSANEALTGADVSVVLTEWPEFYGIEPSQIAELMTGRAVVDMRHLFDPSSIRSAGLTYDGVGRSR